jgi:tetratricopeptide (TPR) repeat protein/serine/threonine protein kinase
MEDASPEMLSLFADALERPSPEERSAFLDAACGANVELRGRIEALLRAHEEAGGSLQDRPASGSPAATIDQAIAERPGTVIGPHKLMEQIGEGGFGLVFVAEQHEPVRRKVALKILKPGMDTRQVVARFEAERQALAIMDHPNIAKVFDGGATVSGRPYFVMELVKGVPITEFCDQNHFTPRQRLELFVPVCQAVQHAHHKGIIHRDLKPSNVLVSRHDTTPIVKVIDFGVAKALGQELTEKTLFTGIAQMIGTPLYMSPEQAGMSDLDVDTRSDIYSLGVLLYELLTGTTPFDKARFKQAAYDEIRRIIREEEPPRPSTRLSELSSPHAPRAESGTRSVPTTLASVAAQRQTEPAKLTKLVRGELDWIVMKCLEKDRNRRYETANGLTMDLQRYLADEPVAAGPPSAGYRLRKFARRNRRGLIVATILGVVLLAAVAAVAGTLGWAARERADRTARGTAHIEVILTEVDRLSSEQSWPEALDTARRAEAVLAGGETDDTTRDRVARVVTDLEFIDRLQRIRLDRSKTVDGDYDHAGAVVAYGRAFRAYGANIEALPAAAALAGFRTGSPLATAVAAGLDDWADALWASAGTKAETREAAERVIAAARILDPDQPRNRLRALWGRWKAPESKEELRRLSAAAASWDPASVVLMGRALGQAGLREEMATLLRQAQQRYPGDFWINVYSVVVTSALGRYTDALRYAGVAVGIRPNIAAAHDMLGAIFCDGIRDYPAAEAAFREAIRLQPDSSSTHYNLGNALREQGKKVEAAACFREAIRLKPDLARAHTNLGMLLMEQGKLNEAVARYREAIRHEPELVEPHTQLGNALRQQRKLVEAEACYREAIRVQPEYAIAHTLLGLSLIEQGKVAEAVACYREVVRLQPASAEAYKELGNALVEQRKWAEAAASFREAIGLKPDYGQAHYDLGCVLAEQGLTAEAIACYRAAIRLIPDHARAYTNLGSLLIQQGKRSEGVACYREAIRHDPNLAQAHNGLGNALNREGKKEEAVACYREAIRVGPKLAAAHNNLGATFLEQGNLVEAAACFREAIRLQPNDVAAHTNLGEALEGQGKPEEAAACYREAIRIDPRNANAHFALATVLSNALGDQTAAETAFREVIRLQPDHAEAHTGLGNTLFNQGKAKEAIACYREAIRRKSDNAQPHYNLGTALTSLGAEEHAAAEAAFREAIRLQPDFAEAHANLGTILHRQGKTKEALACLREALRHQPDLVEANEGLSWLLVTAADPKLRDPAQAVDLARKVVERDPKNGYTLRTLGMAEFQAKKWTAAVDSLKKAADLLPDGDALAWLFLAMAHHQLDQPKQAREWFDRAERWIKEKESKDEIVLRFRTEAAALLGVENSNGKPDKK